MQVTNIYRTIANGFIRFSVAGNDVLHAMLEYLQQVIRQLVVRFGIYDGIENLRLKHRVASWIEGLSALWSGNIGTANQSQFLAPAMAMSGSQMPSIHSEIDTTATCQPTQPGRTRERQR